MLRIFLYDIFLPWYYNFFFCFIDIILLDAISIANGTRILKWNYKMQIFFAFNDWAWLNLQASSIANERMTAIYY